MGKEAAQQHAKDVTTDIGGHERTPGKTTRVQGPGATGDEYVDQGPYKGPDSFLTDGQRQRLTSAFQQRVLAAEGNYQHAAIDVRVDKLLEKDEDLNWMASMLIDLAFGFVVGQVAKALISVRDVKSAHVKQLIEDHIPGFGVNDATPKLNLRERAYQAIGKVSDDHIKGALGAAAGIGKTQATGQLAKARSGESDRKESIAYLDQLRDAASLAYQKMREVPPATATDAELILLFDSMDAQHHLISQYKLALQEKLARFEASKVTKIGREWAYRNTYDDDGRRIHGGEPRVKRDVWVEWHTFESGSPPVLVFQHQDGRDNPDSIEADEPGVMTNGELATGHKVRKLRSPYEDPQGGISNDPKSIYVVPDEFRETAILRHQQMWGTVPAYVHIDESLNPLYFTPDRVKLAQANKARKAKVPKKQL
jgi:hypothetical protein